MLNFAARTAPDISVGVTGIYALLGYAVVFFGLVLLMVVVMTMGKIFIAAAKLSSRRQTSSLKICFIII